MCFIRKEKKSAYDLQERLKVELQVLTEVTKDHLRQMTVKCVNEGLETWIETVVWVEQIHGRQSFSVLCCSFKLLCF